MLTTGLDPIHQLERTIEQNEKLYARWAKRAPSKPLDTVPFNDTELEPWEKANARKVVAGALAGCGASGNALADVLDALGLLPPQPAPEVPGTPKRRQYGQCRYCGRSSIPLRKDGLLTGHARIHHVPVSQARCDGGATQPAKQRRAA